MSDGDRAVRAIRFNRIGAGVMLVLVASTVVLILVGVLPFDARTAVNLVFGSVLAALLFLTARSAQEDLDDPGGVEARFQREAVTASAALLIVGCAVVVGIIVWGLLG